MRTSKLCHVIVASIFSSSFSGVAIGGIPSPTLFTYQGQLKLGGVPVSETCDFEFGLWDGDNDPNPGVQIETTVSLTAEVRDGLFQVELDFGSAAFNGDARWLQVDVCCSSPCSPAFVTLTPRQLVSAAPYSSQTRGLFVDDAGWVGIGTDSPATRMQLEGSGFPGAFFTLNATGGNFDAGLHLKNNGLLQWHIYNRGTDDSFNLRNSSFKPVLVATQEGNVGIGTASPSSETTLHVIAGVDNFGVLVDSLGASGSEIGLHSGQLGYASLVKNAFFAPGWTRFDESKGAFLQEIGPDGDVRFSVAPADTGFIDWNTSLFLTASGNVGVGPNSPEFPFHVKKAHAGEWIAAVHNVGTGSTDSGLLIRADGGSPLRVESSFGNLLTVQQDGNVGIGTDAPTHKLSVVGSADFSGSVGIGTAVPTHALSVAGSADFTGSVGIGDSTPDARLDVERNFSLINPRGAVATFNRTGVSGHIVDFEQDGTVQGWISVSGTTVSYNSFTGSHLAWTSETLERSTLVRLTGVNRRLGTAPDSEVIYGITQSTEPNDAQLLGAYLGPDSSVAAKRSEGNHLVMAVGNGDMWVVDTGTVVHPGDYLISSSVPGCAMKHDRKQFPVGNIVARAAEGMDFTNIKPDASGVKRKRLSVFFESFVIHAEAEAVANVIASQAREISSMRSRIARLESLLSQTDRPSLGGGQGSERIAEGVQRP